MKNRSQPTAYNRPSTERKPDGESIHDSCTGSNNAKTSQRVYINNTRPYAYNVRVNISDLNEPSTLTCNYDFFDINGYAGINDLEDVANARFRWYEGGFTEINGETGKTLSGTFDKDDGIRCAVQVVDLETGWLNQPLYDDGYVNSNSSDGGGNSSIICTGPTLPPEKSDAEIPRPYP